jgi:hypothetical protein
MKRFILFIALSLPVVAILSTFAGFAYAARLKPAQSMPSQPAQVQTLPTISAPTAAPVVGQSNYASLMRTQLEFCYGDILGLTTDRYAARGLRICAANIREMQPPAEWATTHATALRLADELQGMADDYETGVRTVDASKIAAAGDRLKTITPMLKELAAVLPD